MQTLVTRPVIAPEGYFLSNCKLTKAGKQKLENFINEWRDTDCFPMSCDIGAIIDDVEYECCTSETHPVYVVSAEKSVTGDDCVLLFVEGVDYVLEYQSFESHRLERLAYELNELHNTMQDEMARLGW